MLIGQRLRELRESKNLSQGDIEKRTGLVRPYTSRIENGHTVPSIETLEKYARALEVPIYRFFYEGDKPPKKPNLPAESVGKEWPGLPKFARLLARMNERERSLLLGVAQTMARRVRLDRTARLRSNVAGRSGGFFIWRVQWPSSPTV